MTRRPGLARSKPTSGQRGSGCSRPPTPSAPSQRSPPRRPRPTQARAARRADANRVLKLMRSPRDRVPAVSSGPTALLSTARPSPAHVLRGRHTPKMPGGRSNPPEGSEEVKGPFSPPRSLERLAPLELCAHRQIPPSPDLNASACQASERRRDARLAAPALCAFACQRHSRPRCALPHMPRCDSPRNGSGSSTPRCSVSSIATAARRHCGRTPRPSLCTSITTTRTSRAGRSGASGRLVHRVQRRQSWHDRPERHRHPHQPEMPRSMGRAPVPRMIRAATPASRMSIR